MNCECCLKETDALHRDHRAMVPPLTEAEQAIVDRCWSEPGGNVRDEIPYHPGGEAYTEQEKQLCFHAQLECTVASVYLCEECVGLDYPEYWARWGQAHEAASRPPA